MMVQKLENVVIMSLEEYEKIESLLEKVSILDKVKDKNLFQEKIDYAKKSLEGVELPSSKVLTKECFIVGINPHNREDVKNLLEMYGQKIDNSTLRRLSSSEFVNQITCICFDGDTWMSSDQMIDSELLVDLDYFKSILEKENTIFSDKTEENPKVGDVCKFWSDDEPGFIVSHYLREDNGLHTFDESIYFDHAKTLTTKQAQELLFGKESTNV